EPRLAGGGDADHDHASVAGQTGARDPAVLFEPLDQQGHRRLRHALQLRELRHAARAAAEYAEHLSFGSRDLGVADLLDEEPDEQRGPREQMGGDLLDSRLARRLWISEGVDGHHIVNYIVI